MAAAISWIFWVHSCTVGGSGGTLSISLIHSTFQSENPIWGWSINPEHTSCRLWLQKGRPHNFSSFPLIVIIPILSVATLCWTWTNSKYMSARNVNDSLICVKWQWSVRLLGITWETGVKWFNIPTLTPQQLLLFFSVAFPVSPPDYISLLLRSLWLSLPPVVCLPLLTIYTLSVICPLPPLPQLTSDSSWAALRQHACLHQFESHIPVPCLCCCSQHLRILSLHFLPHRITLLFFCIKKK